MKTMNKKTNRRLIGNALAVQTTLNLSATPVVFENMTAARETADKYDAAVMHGEFGAFWVVSKADAKKLMKAGFVKA